MNSLKYEFICKHQRTSNEQTQCSECAWETILNKNAIPFYVSFIGTFRILKELYDSYYQLIALSKNCCNFSKALTEKINITTAELEILYDIFSRMNEKMNAISKNKKGEQQ